MQVVKQVLGQSLNRNEELYEQQRLLTRELETVSLELKSIQRQIEELDEMIETGRTSERRRRREMPKIQDTDDIPDAPLNPAKARSAFRTLLASKEKEDKITPFPLTEGESEQNEGASLRHKVEECNAMGLSVTEIAEQLNLGRGEVRLMLSLKEEQ